MKSLRYKNDARLVTFKFLVVYGCQKMLHVSKLKGKTMWDFFVTQSIYAGCG